MFYKKRYLDVVPHPIFEKMTGVVKHAMGNDERTDDDSTTVAKNAVVQVLQKMEQRRDDMTTAFATIRCSSGDVMVSGTVIHTLAVINVLKEHSNVISISASDNISQHL